MAQTLTNPGVYIEELKSGVRPITGVATSITAFVGRAQRGPIDTPVTLTSYADFERTFGGLWTDSHLGYSVQDFFRLGGSTAIVVRAYPAGSVTADTYSIGLGTGNRRLSLNAASPGLWGKGLSASIDKDVATTPSPDPNLFNLQITDAGTGTTEMFRNVSIDAGSARRVDIIVNQQSSLVRVQLPLPTNPQSTATVTAAAGGGSGSDAAIAAADVSGSESAKTGIWALEKTDLFNLLVIPPYAGTGQLGDLSVDAAVITDAITYATKRRAVVVLDSPPDWTTVDLAKTGATAASYPTSPNAATYFPRVRQPDRLRENQIVQFAPSGAIAGVIAATDASRGVWKAPAGLDAVVAGVAELGVSLTDGDIGKLNPVAVNCLRATPGVGHVIWGARTRQGDDRQASEWKYLPVRRTALFLEESLYRGIQWAVFEPNDEPLWAQLRLNIGSFLNGLFRQGAFQGTTPREAYFVKCDKETTTQADINLGIVNILVGFAPLKPAEFVVLRLQQMAGQIAT